MKHDMNRMGFLKALTGGELKKAFRDRDVAFSGDYARQLSDKTTRDFITYLKTEPLLKGILAGHLHIDVNDRFSPTANEYVVAGNFMFRGQHVLFT